MILLYLLKYFLYNPFGQKKKIVLVVVSIVVKGAPRLRAARRYPSAPRLKVGDAPSRKRSHSFFRWVAEGWIEP